MSGDTRITVLVSPAEPKSMKDALGEGEVSALPERYGVDFLWRARGVWWGAQRKTVSDFLASWADGRLVREVSQMVGHVSLPVIIIEGRLQFTEEGELLNKWGTRLTRDMWRSIVLTLASKGITVMMAATMNDTAGTIRAMVAWSEKATHTSVTSRPKLVESTWGKPTNRDWGVFLLQSFDGVGAGVAGDVFDHFGRVPMRWDVSREELLAVKGLGPKRVDRMLAALEVAS